MITHTGTATVTSERRTFGPMWTATRTLAARSCLRPRMIENIVEISHVLHTLAHTVTHVVGESGEKFVIAQTRPVNVLLLERRLRRL